MKKVSRFFMINNNSKAEYIPSFCNVEENKEEHAETLNDNLGHY